MADLLINTMRLFPFSISQAAKEKRFLELCYDGTADIRDFSSLLAQGVDPEIYDQVGATAWQKGSTVEPLYSRHPSDSLKCPD